MCVPGNLQALAQSQLCTWTGRSPSGPPCHRGDCEGGSVVCAACRAWPLMGTGWALLLGPLPVQVGPSCPGLELALEIEAGEEAPLSLGPPQIPKSFPAALPRENKWVATGLSPCLVPGAGASAEPAPFGPSAVRSLPPVPRGVCDVPVHIVGNPGEDWIPQWGGDAGCSGSGQSQKLGALGPTGASPPQRGARGPTWD